MNYKRIRLFSILGLSLSLLASCSQDKGDPQLGNGNFKLSIETDNEVIPVLRNTQVASGVNPSAEDFAITLTNEDGSYTKSWSTINNIPSDATYDVGNYTISASYGSLEEEGFDTPHYKGETKFTIRDQETTAVDVTCTLAHVKVSLQYTEAFTKYFADYNATIRSASGKELTVTRDETRDAYVIPGDITLRLNLTKPSGVSATFEPAKIKDATARQHYIVTFDVTESVGAAILTIVFDNETEVEPITIDITDEAMVAPAPYIKLEGIENNGSIEVQECDLPDSGVLGASITARGGLTGCTLTTTSEYLIQEGFPAQVELSELTPEQTALFERMGLEVKGFGNNVSKMGYVNFATLTPSLQIATNGNSNHTFTLTARDANGKVSEPVSFTITSIPLTLSIGELEKVMLGSTGIDIPMTFNGKDIKKLKVYQDNNGKANEIPYTVLSNNAENYTLHATIEIGNTPQSLYLSYADRRNTESKKIDITVPPYTLICNDYDVWTTRAAMRVTATDAAYQDVIEKYISFYVNESNGWKEFSPEKTSRGYNITGLTAGETYNFKTSCLSDQSDMEQSPIMKFTTEAALNLPNTQFEEWTSWFSETINKGGKYGKIAGTVQETQVLSSSDPTGWATVNTKTVPTNPSTKNTWYMVPSTLVAPGVSGNAALIRNVAWDNNGSTPPQGNWGLSQSLSSLNAPSIANRSAGKLFLGTYFYNHDSGVELYNEGIAFTSRPAKLSGYYKYIAKGGDTNGVVTITVEHRTASGEVITLATRTLSLNPASNFTYFEAALSYTNVQYKATHLKVMFASSNNASKSQSSESSTITTIDNKAQAISVGSELYIDNISLSY